MSPSSDYYPWNHQWLRVHLIIELYFLQQTERSLLDLSGRKNRLVLIPARTIVIVVIGRNRYLSGRRHNTSGDEQKNGNGKRSRATDSAILMMSWHDLAAYYNAGLQPDSVTGKREVVENCPGGSVSDKAILTPTISLSYCQLQGFH